MARFCFEVYSNKCLTWEYAHMSTEIVLFHYLPLVTYICTCTYAYVRVCYIYTCAPKHMIENMLIYWISHTFWSEGSRFWRERSFPVSWGWQYGNQDVWIVWHCQILGCYGRFVCLWHVCVSICSMFVCRCTVCLRVATVCLYHMTHMFVSYDTNTTILHATCHL